MMLDETATIDLDIDESNTLAFKVKIEGTEAVANPAKVRLVCEAGDVAYMFNGVPVGDDIVEFTLPSMKEKLKEGLYTSKVEVLVDSRYFSPVEFGINFKRPIKVVAEAVTKVITKKQPEIRVSASPIQVVKREQSVIKQIPVEVPVHKSAPPPVKENAQVLLRERHVDVKVPVQQQQEKSSIQVQQKDEDSFIDTLAKRFIMKKSNKR